MASATNSKVKVSSASMFYKQHVDWMILSYAASRWLIASTTNSKVDASSASMFCKKQVDWMILSCVVSHWLYVLVYKLEGFKDELCLYELQAAHWLDDSKLCCLSLVDLFSDELECREGVLCPSPLHVKTMPWLDDSKLCCLSLVDFFSDELEGCEGELCLLSCVKTILWLADSKLCCLSLVDFFSDELEGCEGELCPILPLC